VTAPAAAPAGYRFLRFWVVHAEFETSGKTPPGPELEVKADYHDQVVRVSPRIEVEQRIVATIFPKSAPSDIAYTASATLRGEFERVGDAQPPPAEFAEDNALALLYPFTREWIHRLTSGGALPPLLLPPMNIKAIHRARAEAAKAQQ
jgi:preprotein translocase subunit SecB